MSSVDIIIITVVVFFVLLHIIELILLYSFNSFYYTHGVVVRKGSISFSVDNLEKIIANIEELGRHKQIVTNGVKNDLIFIHPVISGHDYLLGTGLSIKLCMKIIYLKNGIRVRYWSRYIITHRLLALAIIGGIYGVEWKSGSLDFSFMPEIVLALIFFALLIISFFSSRNKTRQIVKGILGVTS